MDKNIKIVLYIAVITVLFGATFWISRVNPNQQAETFSETNSPSELTIQLQKVRLVIHLGDEDIRTLEVDVSEGENLFQLVKILNEFKGSASIHIR